MASEQKNTSGSSGDSKKGSSQEKSTQGGTHEQHVKAGQQSHKNTSDKSDDSKKGSSQQKSKNS